MKRRLLLCLLATAATCARAADPQPKTAEEILRIVRMLAQYFYPQRQTKVMNEGCATFCHYEIMNRLYDKGLITEGSITREEGLAFADSPTNLLWRLQNETSPVSRQPPKPEEPDPASFSEIILDVRPEETKLQTNFGRLV
jgi:spore cortex formation protein SpoVR/YcgB (stage V sporulation)